MPEGGFAAQPQPGLSAKISGSGAGYVLPSSRMRITELVVWDCALAFVVVGLVVANSVLAPAAPTETPPPEQRQDPPPAQPDDPKQTDANADDAPQADRRRRGRRRRGRSRRDTGGSRGGSPLDDLRKQALAARDAEQALAVLKRAKAHDDDPGYAMFRAEVGEHVVRLDAVPALLPQAQHLADLREADRLAALVGGLPADADRAPLDAELKLARRAAPDAARVKTFRPGWKVRDASWGKLASDLDDATAQRLSRELEHVVELAGRLANSPVPALTFTVEIDATAALPAPATLRRDGEAPEALYARARWALAAHLAAAWKLPEPLAAGVSAYLAGCADGRGTLAPCGQRWARLLRAHGLRGDGEAVLEVQSGDADWLLTWGWVAFAASDGSEPATRARGDLQASIAQGRPLPTWDASKATEAERSWISSLETP